MQLRKFAWAITLLASTLVLANPVEVPESDIQVVPEVKARSAAPPPTPPPPPRPPPPCTPISPPPTTAQTKDRFNAFANALLVQKDLNAAFRYISATYINHHAGVGNGAVSAYDFLYSLDWSKANIQVKNLAFQGNMSWADYTYSGHGEVVDRFRWEAGCIVEHWDSGEKIPAGATD